MQAKMEKTVAARERAKNHFANDLAIKRIIENTQLDWVNTVDEQRLCSVQLFKEFWGYLAQLKQRDDVNFYQCDTLEYFLSVAKVAARMSFEKYSICDKHSSEKG